MKKVGIITLNGNYNFGNKLQNYAMLSILQRYTNKVDNIWIAEKDKFKKSTNKISFPKTLDDKKFNTFCDFTNKYINIKRVDSIDKIDSSYYDYFIVGSDQVWNPTFPFFDQYSMFLDFSKDINKNIAYAASIGVSEIPNEYKETFKKGLDNFKAISVREDNAKKIIEDVNGRTDSEVVIDPVLVIPSSDWDKIAQKPKGFNENEKYVLTCFLGEFSTEHRKEINDIASKNNWRVINLMDENNPYYTCGPREFVYLEKHAEVIFTDSFHSSVFAIIYNRPFVIYDRVSDDVAPMNARIDTLLNMFKLNDRLYIDSITEKNLKCDYSEANVILEEEQDKALSFIESALDIN